MELKFLNRLCEEEIGYLINYCIRCYKGEDCESFRPFELESSERNLTDSEGIEYFRIKSKNWPANFCYKLTDFNMTGTTIFDGQDEETVYDKYLHQFLSVCFGEEYVDALNKYLINEVNNEIIELRKKLVGSEFQKRMTR